MDSCIEMTIIIYQIEAHLKLHNMIWSHYEKSFLYPNSIVYITYRVFKVFDAPFSFYLLPVLYNIVIKVILVPNLGSLYMCSINLYSSKKIRDEKRKGDVVHISKNNKTFDKYVLQLSTEITFDSGIETTIIIYQVEARIKLHIMIWSRSGNHFGTQIPSFT